MGECPVWDEAAGQLLYLDIFEQIRTCVAGNRRACVCRCGWVNEGMGVCGGSEEGARGSGEWVGGEPSLGRSSGRGGGGSREPGEGALRGESWVWGHGGGVGSAWSRPPTNPLLQCPRTPGSPQSPSPRFFGSPHCTPRKLFSGPVQQGQGQLPGGGRGHVTYLRHSQVPPFPLVRPPRRPGDHVGSCMMAAGTRVGLLDWDLQDMQWMVQLEGDKPGIRVNYGPCGAVCDK